MVVTSSVTASPSSQRIAPRVACRTTEAPGRTKLPSVVEGSPDPWDHHGDTGRGVTMATVEASAAPPGTSLDWIVSVDDHVIEPPNVWLDRLPKRYADAAPRMEETEPARSGGSRTRPSPPRVCRWRQARSATSSRRSRCRSTRCALRPTTRWRASTTWIGPASSRRCASRRCRGSVGNSSTRPTTRSSGSSACRPTTTG